MARKLKSDKVLFLATLLLALASIVMVYSASAVIAEERFHRPYLFLIKQSMWVGMGLAMLGLIMRVDYRTWKQPVLIWSALGLVLIALIAVLFSAPINGTRRWFGIGGFGVQPSELAKLAVIFFTAALLERRMHRIDEARYSLLPIGLVIGAVTALVLLEPDFGTAVSIVLVAAVMVFAAGSELEVRRVFHLPPGAADDLRADERRLSGQAPDVVHVSGVRSDGCRVPAAPVADCRSARAASRGKGLMAGVQKLFYLPEPHTDFIFAVIGEELGLVGTTLTLLAFLIITWRGVQVAARAPDRFGAFLALGLTGMIAVQAFINLSVVLGLMPTKGIPLPFVSAGGSSLLINLVGHGHSAERVAARFDGQ